MLRLSDIQVDASLGFRALPSSVAPKTAALYGLRAVFDAALFFDVFIDDPSKDRPKHFLKFFLHASGSIAAKFHYDQALVNAVKKIPKATWNAKERLWIFPLCSLSSAEDILRETPGLNVEVENLDSLVQRAIGAATAVPDLQG
ncbi:Cytochrome f [Bienertia sinuspersici]